jgi:hypothetical protein
MAATINPEFKHVTYTRLLVIARFGDLGLQQELENKLCSQLELLGVTCQTGHEFFFRASEYTIDEVGEKLDKKGIQAVLIVMPLDAGVSKTTLPEELHSDTKSWLGRSSGGYYYNERSTIYKTGGQTIRKPWASFEVRLWDIASDDVVWYATAQTAGNAFASFTTVVRSMASKTVSRLSKAGLVGDRNK